MTRLTASQVGQVVKRVTHQVSADVIKPRQNLRKVAFQECRQAVANPRSVIDQTPPMLAQVL